MSGGSGENTRGLPNGIKTRDELKALILKHGFLAESEVLAHINRTAKPVWTHNDFVNFFQTSGQMVFQVKNNHLYLAPSDDDSSDGETCDIRSTLSVRNKTQSSNTVGTRNLTESFSRGMTGLGSNGASYSASGSSERRKEPRLAARNRPSSSSSDEDNTRSGGHRKPGSSGAPKALPLIRPPPGFERRPEYEAVPYGTDEEEGETHRLDSKVDVFKLVNSHRRCYRSPADADQMVTMDPDPANKVVPKINLGTKPDDDSSNDSDDENSDSGRPTQIARNRPPPVLQKPQASLQGGSANHRNENGASSAAKAPAVHRDLNELDHRKPNFFNEYCAIKEDKDFSESRERNAEKILRDVMEMGEIPRADAELYFEYFVLLQSFDIEYLSNGQLVAGILALIEADSDGEMLRRIRESDERRHGG